MISMVNLGGLTTTYAYDWAAALATAGLGVFGGRIKTTHNSANRVMTEGADYFGRTVDRVDYAESGTFAGHDYDYLSTSPGG